MWSKMELIDKQAEFWVVLARGSTLQAAALPPMGTFLWGLDLHRDELAGSGEQNDVPRLGAVAFAVVVRECVSWGSLTDASVAHWDRPARVQRQ